MKPRCGSIMIFCYLVSAFLMACGAALSTRSHIDHRAASRQRDSAHAFQLAEAGVDQALTRLQSNFNAASIPATALDAQQSFQVTIIQQGDLRIVQSRGTTTQDSTMSKEIEVIVQRSIPQNFYDNAMYGAHEVTINGQTYLVVGNVVTGEANGVPNTTNIVGTIYYDPSASPLPKLSFEELHEIAVAQGNVYDAARLDAIHHGAEQFPTSFCNTPPSDPEDPSSCVPNVNYLTEDLVLNGNVGTIAGLFVVVGNVLTDPADSQDATINGNGQIAGMIYTTGEFTVNGGGGGLNVLGGVWAGQEARINGNVTIQYHATYMQSVKNLGLTGDVRVLCWKECSPAGC